MTYVVYEHWRPDTNACFYVGKGKMRRARSFEARNDRYGKIVAKLKRAGLQPEVRIVLIDLDSEGALKAEVERIRQRRAEGVDLANYTDGGDGAAGRRHSAATRAKIAAKATGRKMSPETIAKMAAARTGQKRTDDTRAKQSASAKIAQKLRFEKLKQTRAGRRALQLRMTAIAHKGRGTPEYSEQKRQAGLASWRNRS
jgi:phosphopantothenoylcysteine synthetase/decarboxylase